MSLFQIQYFLLHCFWCDFIVMGIRNIRTVRQLKIIGYASIIASEEMKNLLYTHQLSRWIRDSTVASIAVLGMMFALIMKVSIQPHILCNSLHW